MEARSIDYNWITSPFHGLRNGPVQSIILHSTEGHKSGDLQTLASGDNRSISVHWYVTRTGRYYHFVQNGERANHVGPAIAVKYSNSRSIGIEQEHVDGVDNWPDVQVQAVANLVAFLWQNYGPIQVTTHALVASPRGRKTDPVNYPWAVFNKFLIVARLLHWNAIAIRP